MRYGLIVLSAVVLLLAHVSWAEEESAYDQMRAAQARITELERENRALQAQVAMLRGELRHAQAELEKATATPIPEVETSPTAAESPTESDAISEVAAINEATQPAAMPVYSSLLQIMRGLPPELKPNPRTGNWGPYEGEKLRAHLAAAYRGHRFETMATIQSVSRRPSFNKNEEWDVTVHLREERYEFGRLNLIQRLGPFTFRGDEAFSRRACRLQAGDRVPIRGTIHRITKDLDTRRGAFAIRFSEVDLDAPRLRQ